MLRLTLPIFSTIVATAVTIWMYRDFGWAAALAAGFVGSIAIAVSCLIANSK